MSGFDRVRKNGGTVVHLVPSRGRFALCGETYGDRNIGMSGWVYVPVGDESKTCAKCARKASEVVGR